MEHFAYPTRSVLIVGAVKAALFGMEARRISELRRAGKDRDSVAYTQQAMRVSHEEWESVVRVKLHGE